MYHLGMDEIYNIYEQGSAGHTGTASGADFSEIPAEPVGFDWLISVVDGIQNLDPRYQARKDIFLNDADQVKERNALLNALETWSDVLQASEKAGDMAAYCFAQANEQEATIRENLLNMTHAVRPLEKTYRNAALFFANAGAEQVHNISFANCSKEQLGDLNFPKFIDHLAEELKRNFDRIDLRNNYSIVALSGYLGSNAVIEKWAKIAHQNKAVIVTDFSDLDEVDDVLEMFELAGLSGGDIYRSSILMCCNWLVGRGKYEAIGEADDLHVPPSGALAGKLYSSQMSQVAAGKKFGIIEGVDGVKFQLKKSEVSVLEKMNIIPMVQQYGKVMACAAKTLFNGANLGLQVYSVVRVFDYVSKVLMDFLNRRAFENFNANIRKDLMAQIVKFLDSISGNGRLIEDFSVKRFEQDAAQKDKIHLDIHIKPYFPAKNFMIKMEGKKGEDGANWDTSYD
ncbi:MAG: type VI secretion system contractile sheath protein TssC [Niabella sp.]